jgi:hypothetical protein
MKIPLFSCFLLFSLIANVHSQNPKYDGAVPGLPLADNKIVYSAQIPVDSSIDRSLIFVNAEKWYKKNFQTADNTLIVDNANFGALSGTGIIHAKNPNKGTDPGDVFFTIDIHVPRGMYVYKVYDIYGFDKTGKFYYSDMYSEEQYPTDKPKWPEPYRHTMLNDMNNKIAGMIAELQKEMSNPGK